MADLSVNIGELQMNNPVMTASGTFGYGEEFADFIELSRIGGIIVKIRQSRHGEITFGSRLHRILVTNGNLEKPDDC